MVETIEFAVLVIVISASGVMMPSPLFGTSISVGGCVLVWAFAGILIVFALHIWIDFTWLGTIPFLASKSFKFLSDRSHKLVMSGL